MQIANLSLHDCHILLYFSAYKQPYYLADLTDLYRPSRCLQSTNCHLPVLNLLLLLKLFVYLHLITEILSLCISAHLTVLLLLNPNLNLTFSLLHITSSHSHASDSTFDYWRYINI